MWIVWTLLAALAGALVATLSKAGLKTVDPGLGLAVQSVVILALSWGAVAAQGKLGELRGVDGKVWAYLLLSGAAATASYLLLFRALKLGDAARVLPLDRLSLVFGIVLAAVFLGERVGWQVALGGMLMAAGALVIATAAR